MVIVEILGNLVLAINGFAIMTVIDLAVVVTGFTVAMRPPLLRSTLDVVRIRGKPVVEPTPRATDATCFLGAPREVVVLNLTPEDVLGRAVTYSAEIICRT